jgi:hypothetical protein
MSATALRHTNADSRRLALVLSVALHGAILYMIARAPLLSVDTSPPRASVSVVWLRDWPTPPVATPPAPAAPPQPVEVPPPEAPAAETAPETPGAADRITPTESNAPESPPALAPAPAATGPITDGNEPTALRSIPTAAEWDAAREEAITSVLDAQERERAYSTFSMSDIFEDLRDPPEPWRAYFAVDSRTEKLRNAPRPPGRLARSLSSLCRAITGSFAMLGISSACGDTGPRNDLFLELKPDYLRRVPDCTETESEATGSAPAMKCRLVEPALPDSSR